MRTMENCNIKSKTVEHTARFMQGGKNEKAAWGGFDRKKISRDEERTCRLCGRLRTKMHGRNKS